jgi:SAM-dependent methyltransferase
MKEIHLKLFACPECQAEIILASGEEEPDGRIREGILQCIGCQQRYDVKNYIPRFVPLKNYCQGFGLEWSRHARTQYDSYTGVNLSETRFFQETKWANTLHDEIVLEVGCGSGRFTEQAAKTGAMVVSVDLSGAVEANYALNGHKPNVLIAQADIYKLPFRYNFFDRIFCFGVLQHTPDVQRSFQSLTPYLKPGASLAVDVYKRYSLLKRLLVTKYWLRPFTTKIDPDILYSWCERYVDFMWPLTKFFNKIPKIGRHINWSLFVADFSNNYPLTNEIAKEWAILDTFDRLSPYYDFPQTLKTVQNWFIEAKFQDIDVHYGYNGIEGRGVKT